MGKALTADSRTDQKDPLSRLGQLLDDGSLTPLHESDESAVSAVRGTVDGHEVPAYCTDARRRGGALTADGCAHIMAPAVRLGLVDEVIRTVATRRRLIQALAAAPARRGDHGKHPATRTPMDLRRKPKNAVGRPTLRKERR
jgi:acetyl-CoA carboxylase carboxyltransferase component